MALDGAGLSAESEGLIDELNDVCVWVFIFEAVARIAATGFLHYISEPWHVFDFGVVLFAVVDWVVTLEAAVFGVPDEKWGEAVHAAVYLRPGSEGVTAEDLVEFCRASLGGYKVPKGVDLHDDVLPKSGPGKFLKRSLRAPYWDGYERAVH